MTGGDDDRKWNRRDIQRWIQIAIIAAVIVLGIWFLVPIGK
jgi:hypothetical protein